MNVSVNVHLFMMAEAVRRSSPIEFLNHVFNRRSMVKDRSLLANLKKTFSKCQTSSSKFWKVGF